MATPIIEQIRRDRIAALRTIKIANGYSFDAAVRGNDPVEGTAPRNGLIVLSQIARNLDTELAGDGAQFGRWVAMFAVDVFCPAKSKDDLERDYDEIANAAMADVETALNLDRQCGELAELSEIESIDQWEAAQPGGIVYPGFTLRFNVTYEAILTEPDTQDPP